MPRVPQSRDGRSWPSTETSCTQHPIRVAVDERGQLYLADTGNERIVKLSATGRLPGVSGSGAACPGQFESPSGMPIDRVGNLYVADTFNPGVQTLTVAR